MKEPIQEPAAKRPQPRGAAVAGSVLRPLGWQDVEGLVCGFGDRHCDAPPGTWTLARQVHGTTVVEVLCPAPPDGAARLAHEADALVMRRRGVVGGVRTADCVPLLMVAAGGGWAAAVHAGWRGTLAGISALVVERARSDGISAGQLRAALGPSIDGCCYEVSHEIGERFASEGLPVLTARGREGRPHLDLRAVNTVLLERAGLPAEAIQRCGPCTRCACESYHSYRAEPHTPGRQISWIGWEDRTRPAGR